MMTDLEEEEDWAISDEPLEEVIVEAEKKWSG